MSRKELIQANEEMWEFMRSIEKYLYDHRKVLPSGADYHARRAISKLASAKAFIVLELKELVVENVNE